MEKNLNVINKCQDYKLKSINCFNILLKCHIISFKKHLILSIKIRLHVKVCKSLDTQHNIIFFFLSILFYLTSCTLFGIDLDRL